MALIATGKSSEVNRAQPPTSYVHCFGPTSTVLEILQLCNRLEKSRASVPGGDKYFIISACHYSASERICQLKALLKNFVELKRAVKRYGA